MLGMRVHMPPANSELATGTDRQTQEHPLTLNITPISIQQNTMADSPGSSDLSDPPSQDSDQEDQLSTAVPSSRPSVERAQLDHDLLAPPPKRRKTGASTSANLERAPSSQPGPDDDDDVSISSDSFSSAPGSPSQNEHALRDEAQTECLWKDCPFGDAANNDELVQHVQSTHCATGGPKKSKYTCEWGECQRKTSNHPSGYALKAHMRSHTKEKPYYCSLPGVYNCCSLERVVLKLARY